MGKLCRGLELKQLLTQIGTLYDTSSTFDPVDIPAYKLS